MLRIRKDKGFRGKLLKLLTTHAEAQKSLESFLNASKEDESLTSPEIWKKFAAAWHALNAF